MNIVEDSEVDPICPHCEREMHSLLSKRVKSFLGVRFIYFCEHCRKVLGVSQRKGFWMG